MKKNKLPVLLILVAVIVAGGYYWFSLDNKGEKIPYSVFYEKVESHYIKSVTIDADKITFKDPVTNCTIYTDNPQSPVLQEYLMRNGVEVTVEKDFSEIIYLILDCIFYIFFFGIFIFAFRKFISPNGNSKIIILKVFINIAIISIQITT